MVVARAANVVVQQRRAVRGSRRRRLVDPVIEDRADRGVGQRADLDSALADRLGSGGINAASRRSTPRQVRKPCSGCGRRASIAMISPSVFGPMGMGLMLQPFRRPFAISTVCARRHVLGLGAVPRSAVTPGMRGDAFAAVEHLDRAGRGTGVHLLTDQGVRHRVEKALDLDVVINPDAGEALLGILIVLLGQWLHDRAFNRLKELATADTKSTHLAAIHPLDGRVDLSVAGSQ